MSVDVAVIPAAGLGTRFLPYTKSSPKEMLPIIDRPTIEYIVDEAVRAGIGDVLVVTARGKAAIEDHFDRAPELEAKLSEAGRFDDLAALRRVADAATVHFVRQSEPLGLGHAVGVARDHVGQRTFAVLLGDDIIHPDVHVLEQMIAVHEPEDISLYGCADVETTPEGLVRVRGMVEKPAAEDAPSNLAVIGRYVLRADVFDAIDATRPGAGGEIQLTDAISSFAERGEVYGVVADRSARYDVGKKIDYLRTIVEFALERDDLGAEFATYLADLVKSRDLL